MAKKTAKETFYPIVMCGSFFATSDLEPFLKDIDENDIVSELTEKFKEFFEGVDFTQYPAFMKHLIMIHTSQILYEDAEEDAGFYVGLPFYSVPEHFSIKRMTVDVRNLFVNSGLVPDSVDPNFVKVFAKILKVTE